MIDTLIRPFRGLRPTKKFLAEVIAPPYDVLSSNEARERARNKPWSFLHISKPEIDLPENINSYDSSVYAKAAENFTRMKDAGVLQQDDADCYYVYRIIMGQHQQTGLVAAASVSAYQQQRIRKHEQTQPAKVTDRIKQITVLNAQTGPVLLAYPAHHDVDTLLQSVAKDLPEFDVIADGGIKHQLWVIKDREKISQLSKAFAGMENLYIADGHHRSEAAAQVANMRDQCADDASRYFLAVMFPDNQLQILAYHRVIKDLHGLSASGFLKKIDSHFVVQPQQQAVSPQRAQQFGMYLAGQWYLLQLRPEKILQSQAAESLDVSLLANFILQPILGIQDPRRDPRIDFVGGIRGTAELEKRVDSGEMAVAFSVFPTQMRDIIQVANANQFMPPKSTWFEPKLADGLVSHLL